MYFKEKRLSIKQLETVKIRWNDKDDVNKNSESAKNLARNTEHDFNSYLITRVPENTLKERIQEAYFIKSIVPSLNEPLDNNV